MKQQPPQRETRRRYVVFTENVYGGEDRWEVYAPNAEDAAEAVGKHLVVRVLEVKEE